MGDQKISYSLELYDINFFNIKKYLDIINIFFSKKILNYMEIDLM